MIINNKSQHTMIHLDTIQMGLATLDVAAIALFLYQSIRSRKQIRKEL